jgi:hypothetical protein
LQYPPSIASYAFAFERSVLGLTGWQLMDRRKVEDLLMRGVRGEDPFGLPSKVVDGVTPTSLSLREVEGLIEGRGNITLMVSLLAQQLVGHCYEIMSKRPGFPSHREAGPILEFFRHVRNACFHANRFRFDKGKGEPRFPAEWRGLTVTLELEKASPPVFQETTPFGECFLGWGDALLLIADACAEVFRPEEYGQESQSGP